MIEFIFWKKKNQYFYAYIYYIYFVKLNNPWTTLFIVSLTMHLVVFYFKN